MKTKFMENTIIRNLISFLVLFGLLAVAHFILAPIKINHNFDFLLGLGIIWFWAWLVRDILPTTKITKKDFKELLTYFKA